MTKATATKARKVPLSKMERQRNTLTVRMRTHHGVMQSNEATLDDSASDEIQVKIPSRKKILISLPGTPGQPSIAASLAVPRTQKSRLRSASRASLAAYGPKEASNSLKGEDAPAENFGDFQKSNPTHSAEGTSPVLYSFSIDLEDGAETGSQGRQEEKVKSCCEVKGS